MYPILLVSGTGDEREHTPGGVLSDTFARQGAPKE